MINKLYIRKRFRYLIIMMILLLNGISNESKAQLVLVPDSNFRNDLITQGFGSCFTGNYIDSTCSKVRGCTFLELYYNNINDITGILAFNNLTTLSFSNISLSYFPILPTSLIELYCSNNNLTNITALPINLEILNCEYNQLSYLPHLPNNLIKLTCNNNNLNYLPALPNNLDILWCAANNLTYLPTLPINLTNLNCENNHITSLPAPTNSLFFLNCSRNNLTTLPTLPASITEFHCDYNVLSALPTLPNMIEFSCANNKLNSLPSLPIGLEYLFCTNNLLLNMPSLPNSLKQLDCSFNQLTSIPDLPDSLQTLSCDNNPDLTCLPHLNNLYGLSFSGTNIHCLPNYPNVYTSYPLLSSLPLCGFFDPNDCNINWNISGKTYLDQDSNCVYNTSDFNERNYKVQLFKNGNLIQQAFTGEEGYYSFDTDSLGIYEIQLDTTGIPLDIGCPISFTHTDTLVPNDTLKYYRDFSMKCKNGFDLAAWSIYVEAFRVAHTADVYVSAGDYSNQLGAHCANGISGTVNIVYNGAVSYVGPMSGALTPTNINGDTLTYTVADFGIINYSTAFNFILAVDTLAILGSPVCISVAISPALDNNPANNFISQCFTVRSSFDPNEKIVSPANTVDINGDRWLTYTVNFQNTGNASAEHIYITDTLDTNLDWSSFQLLAYSHQPYVQILEGGVAKFNFPNINLPDSVSNEPGSHGYVQYKIKANDSLTAGISISNTANIYFDYNAPVITNTITNSVINCGQNIQSSSVSICDGQTYNFNGLILTASGNYSQKFISNSGCDSIVNLNLQVNPKYSISITENICDGDFYQFNGQNIMLPGVYFLNSATSLGCDSIVTLTLIVDQINTTVTQLQDTLFASATNASYQWINCTTGNIIAGATSQNYSPTISGNYAVIVTLATCTDTSSCYYLSLTGINENYASEIQISPNPSSNEFVVYCPQQLIGKTVTFNIYDAYGKLVDERKLNSQNTIIKAYSWAKGIYFMQIKSEGNVIVRKLVKN